MDRNMGAFACMAHVRSWHKLMSFRDKLLAASEYSSAVVRLAPRLAALPLRMQRYDEPFLPYSRAITEATNDIVAGYMFDLAAYLVLGAAGAIALERSVALVDSPAVTILHGAFASPEYAAVAFDSTFNFDAATVASEIYLEGFGVVPDRGVFVVRHGAILEHVGYEDVFWIDQRCLTAGVDDTMLKLQVVEVSDTCDNFDERLREYIKAMRDE